jgi:hypothetical protein
MKKGLIIAIIGCLSILPVPGRCLDNRLFVTKNPPQEVIDSNKVTTVANDSVGNSQINKALLISIESLQKDKSQLLSEIENLKKDTAELSKRNRIQIDEINKLNNKIRELDKSANQYRSKYETLVNDISKLDAVIYKQCLLYPLEGKYDSLLVSESLKSIQSFSSINKNLSKKFIEYRETYEPLLKRYKDYNTQLLTFIESNARYIKATHGVISDAHKTKFENELKQLPYYSECYVNRNKPPYKSIIYLDNVIDKFLSILKKEGNVEIDISELLNSF